jgi:hypothetical protein
MLPTSRTGSSGYGIKNRGWLRRENLLAPHVCCDCYDRQVSFNQPCCFHLSDEIKCFTSVISIPQNADTTALPCPNRLQR